MFQSVRIRLFLSYILIAGVIIGVIGMGVYISLINNPLLYRQSATGLNLAKALINVQVNRKLMNSSPEELYPVFQREAENRKLRIALFRLDGSLVWETENSNLPDLKTLSNRLAQNKGDNSLPGTIIDPTGKPWFYDLVDVQGKYWLFIAIQRTRAPLVLILRDNIVFPILIAGVAALLLGLITSFLMSGWISKPLQKIASLISSHDFNQNQKIPLEGPVEVQQLSNTFNEMIGRLYASQQSQKDFIANVSHELKTPITSIQGFAQAIIDGTVQEPNGLKQSAYVIFKEAGRMHRLVMDLLVLSRLEAGTADLLREPVYLALLLKSVVDKFQMMAQQVGISITDDLNPVPSFIGDGDRLAQVFTNLLDNALKFTPKGGQVHVMVVAEKGFIVVRIIDTGVGIPPQDVPHIFERFYQVDKSRKGGTGRGVGLGLAIARQIILAHKGDITVESELGRGTKFTIFLPITSQKDQTITLQKGKI